MPERRRRKTVARTAIWHGGDTETNCVKEFTPPMRRCEYHGVVERSADNPVMSTGG
jgi:hypothetical protein